jgi:hypothetical protein
LIDWFVLNANFSDENNKDIFGQKLKFYISMSSFNIVVTQVSYCLRR